MGIRKLMTIDDLYSFCLTNNFSHFSCKENDIDEIVVQMPSSFEMKEQTDKDREGLTPFVSKAYHDHINLNKSEIKTEILESTLPSALLRPVLANIIVNKDGVKDFGSHDIEILEDEDGNEYIHYLEQPVGVVFGNNTIEYDEEDEVNRAILHGFLYDGYCQDAIDIINRRGEVSCSVELSVREMSFNAKDKVLTLDDFFVSGLTLLGENVAPGMKGSNVKLESFDINDAEDIKTYADNKTEEKLIAMLEELTNKIDILSNFTINNDTKREEVNLVENIEKFEEEVTTEPIQAEEVTETTTEDYSATEEGEVTATEETIESTAEETPTDEGTEETAVEETAAAEEAIIEEEIVEVEENMEIAETADEIENVEFSREDLLQRLFEISHDELRYALNALISVYRNDNEWCYVTTVYDDYFVMEDWDNEKLYKQSYTKEDDKVSLSGERIEVFKIIVTESEKLAIEEMRSNYSLIKEKLDTYEKNEMNARRNEILNSKEYSVLANNEDFKTLKENMENYSIEDLEKEADLIFAKHVKTTKHFSFATTNNDTTSTNKATFFASSNSSDNEVRKPYGGLFDDYFKNKNN